MPANLPTRDYSLLDAVNRCMLAIGQSPLNDLDTEDSVYKDTALQQLFEHDYLIQSEGWTWNKEEDMDLLPDTDGFVFVPTGTLRVTRAAWQGDTSLKIAQRGNKLYNRDTHSFVFTGAAVKVDLILRMEWESLPQIARIYITLQAAQQMQGAIQTDATVHRITEDEVSSALAALEQAEDEVDQQNNITGNIQVLGALYGVGKGFGGPIRRR